MKHMEIVFEIRLFPGNIELHFGFRAGFCLLSAAPGCWIQKQAT